MPFHTSILISKEPGIDRTRTPARQGVVRLPAKANGAKRKRPEIKVIVVRPSVPNMDVLEEVYTILVASETGQ